MSGQWHIFKNGQKQGPFTPEQIRESLRDGSIDPFDLVAREGSTVQRELVEVDEIFQTSQVVYQDQQARPAAVGDGVEIDLSDAEAASPLALGLSSAPRPEAGQTQASARSADMVLGQGHLALAHPEDLRVTRPAMSQPAAPVRRRKDPKRFQAMDGRGRILGPLSAGEIQALFYKGILDRDVRILKDGSKAMVPVARFVALYSQAKGQRQPMQGAHPSLGVGAYSQPMMRRAVLIRPRAGLSSFTVWALVTAVAFSAAAIWIYETRGRPSEERVFDPGESQVKIPLHRPHIQKLAPPKPDVTPAPVARVTPAPAPATPVHATKAEDPSKQRQRLEELRRRHASKPKPAPKPTPKPTQKPTPKPTSKPKAVFVAPMAPAPAPAAPKPAAASVASLTDGQQISHFGPMTFNAADLAACEGACNIVFNGAGGSVHVAFFKAAFGTQLQSKSGGVFISGSVRKNEAGVKILLSGVQ